MNWIEFKELGTSQETFSPLFVDYVSDYDKVRDFFPGDVKDSASWEDAFVRVGSLERDRSGLVQILSRQNRDFHCGVQTLSNIDSLLNDSTYAVVTGQQVGLFTGPLYTIYKTLTAIKLARKLNEQYPGKQFVPVFWLAGEDHDLAEVSSVGLIDNQNNFRSLEYVPEALKGTTNPGAVGNIELDEGLGEFLESVTGVLVPTEFSEKVMELFHTAYQKGMTYNKSFVHLMNDLLVDSGLIFIDPGDPEVKKVLSPVFEKEVHEASLTSQLMIERSAELERRYHAQVKPKSINLFLLHKRGRYLIEQRNEGYGLKGSRQQFTREEMEEMLREKPDLFSPNVVLRPVCQDLLLPTAAYVAGPAEVAYMAQLGPVYDRFGVPQPLVYPRASATIIEDKVGKVLERFSLDVSDFYRDVELVKQQVAVQVSEVNFDELFGGTKASLDDVLRSLGKGLEKIDPTLMGALKNAQEKIKFQVDALGQKAIAAQKRKDEITMRQIEKAAFHLFPGGVFQERQINVLHYLNKYGLEFLRWLDGELIVDRFKHQIIRM